MDPESKDGVLRETGNTETQNHGTGHVRTVATVGGMLHGVWSPPSCPWQEGPPRSLPREMAALRTPRSRPLLQGPGKRVSAAGRSVWSSVTAAHWYRDQWGLYAFPTESKQSILCGLRDGPDHVGQSWMQLLTGTISPVVKASSAQSPSLEGPQCAGKRATPLSLPFQAERLFILNSLVGIFQQVTFTHGCAEGEPGHPGSR